MSNSDTIEIPAEVLETKEATARFLSKIRAHRDRVKAMDKKLADADERLEAHLLSLMNEEGMDKFSLKGVGTFSVGGSTRLNFPAVEKGGRARVLAYFKQCVQAGIIQQDEVMNLQEARPAQNFIKDLEKEVENYKATQQGKPDYVEIMESPFTSFTKSRISIRKPTTKIE